MAYLSLELVFCNFDNNIISGFDSDHVLLIIASNSSCFAIVWFLVVECALSLVRELCYRFHQMPAHCTVIYI